MRVRILLLALLLLVAGAQALAQRPASGSVELITTLSGHKQNVIAIEFSHDGARLATSSEDGTVRLWSVANGECLATIPGDEKSEPWRISWSADDRKLAITYVGRKSWDVVVWDTPATAPPTIQHRFQNIPSLKFNPWDVMTGEPRLPRWITDASSVISFSPSGKTVITVKHNPQGKFRHPHSYLTLREIANGEELLTVEIPEGVPEIFWSPDEKTIAVMGATFDTRLFDAASGRENGRLPLGHCWPGTWIGSDGCEAFRFSADSAVVLKDMKPIKLWDVRTVSVISELPRARPPALFSPTDARLLATRSEDKKNVSLWRLKWPQKGT
jgi:WD40 repeat protein